VSADLTERAAGLRSVRTPFVLATVVRAQRPTSAKAGDRALVLPDGTIEGFVGGTCAESTVRTQGLRLLRTGESTLLRITPDEADTAESTDGLVTVGNPCLSGGSLEIFLEAMLPPTLMQVVGDAPVARALVTLGTALGYEMRVGAEPVAGADAVVVASHGRGEEAVLRAALAAGVPYVALVASRRRGAAVLAEVGADRSRVHTPAGLDIGARTAPEVALSVLAEFVASRDRRRVTVTRPAADPAGGPVAELVAGPVAGAVPAAVEALDPVCGMAVAVSAGSLRAEHAGQDWYFCGPGCRRAFADNPGRYLT
jgi:xanthine dehydrogenase accessory factor